MRSTELKPFQSQLKTGLDKIESFLSRGDSQLGADELLLKQTPTDTKPKQRSKVSSSTKKRTAGAPKLSTVARAALLRSKSSKVSDATKKKRLAELYKQVASLEKRS